MVIELLANLLLAMLPASLSLLMLPANCALVIVPVSAEVAMPVIETAPELTEKLLLENEAKPLTVVLAVGLTS